MFRRLLELCDAARVVRDGSGGPVEQRQVRGGVDGSVAIGFRIPKLFLETHGHATPCQVLHALLLGKHQLGLGEEGPKRKANGVLFLDFDQAGQVSREAILHVGENRGAEDVMLGAEGGSQVEGEVLEAGAQITSTDFGVDAS